MICKTLKSKEFLYLEIVKVLKMSSMAQKRFQSLAYKLTHVSKVICETFKLKEFLLLEIVKILKMSL